MTHERIQKKFKGHYALDLKAQGPMVAMNASEYMPLVLLVGGSKTPWTEAQKVLFRHNIKEAFAFLQTEAKKDNVFLEWQPQFYEVTLAEEFFAVPDAWHKEIFRACGHDDVEGFHNDMLIKRRLMNTPVLFAVNNAVNKEFASVAGELDPENMEYSVVRFNSHPRSIAHELLHQYGAADLYYPLEIMPITKQYLPDSIMCDGRSIDPLTRYLIGWRDEIPHNAVTFLEKTSHITAQVVKERKLAGAKPKKAGQIDPATVPFKTVIRRVDLGDGMRGASLLRV